MNAQTSEDDQEYLIVRYVAEWLLRRFPALTSPLFRHFATVTGNFTDLSFGSIESLEFQRGGNRELGCN